MTFTGHADYDTMKPYIAMTGKSNANLATLTVVGKQCLGLRRNEQKDCGDEEIKQQKKAFLMPSYK